MSSVSARPERLLLALDEALDHEVHLILYGRSANWLGFDNPRLGEAHRPHHSSAIESSKTVPNGSGFAGILCNSMKHVFPSRCMDGQGLQQMFPRACVHFVAT